MAPADTVGQTRSHWLASGFVGSNFGSANNDLVSVDRSRSFDWGGQVGYLWRGVLGGEFLANFTPSLGINTIGVLFDNPSVSSYMANAVAALPLGAQAQFQPYISAGLGGIQMNFPNGIVGSGIVVNGVVTNVTTSSSARREEVRISVAASWRLPAKSVSAATRVTSTRIRSAALTRRVSRTAWHKVSCPISISGERTSVLPFSGNTPNAVRHSSIVTSPSNLGGYVTRSSLA